MNQIINQEKISIENMLYEIREKQVILDRDLAKPYNVETRILIQKLKRSKEKFPQEFSFQMTNEEFNYWIKKASICIYRTRSCYAFSNFKG